jgi:hypothetical protein
MPNPHVCMYSHHQLSKKYQASAARQKTSTLILSVMHDKIRARLTMTRACMQAADAPDSADAQEALQRAIDARRKKCSWKAYSKKQTKGIDLQHSDSALECEAGRRHCAGGRAGGLYLSVVMVTRHDSSRLCQVCAVDFLRERIRLIYAC